MNERRDSGIGGIDDMVKILEEAKPKTSLLSPGSETAGDDTLTPQGEVGGSGEEEVENVITRIDEVRDGLLTYYSCATALH